MASHWGGTRNGTIIHWPKGIKEKNGIRNQFCHVIDIAPTVLEAAGIPEPIMVNSVMQFSYEGKSMLYTLSDANAPERRDVQYFEMFGNRGIYYKGWSAVTKHRTPWSVGEPPPFDKDNWELYDGSKDWTQAHDLSKEMPEKLAELQRLWLIEATKYNVLPLDDRTYQRFNPDLAGRPQLIKGNSQLFFAGMGRLSESSVLNVKNKSWSVTAELVVPPAGANGVIVHQAGKFGGWSLYAKAGKAKFAYNFLGLKLFTTEATKPVPTGEHQVRMEFKYDGGGLRKAATSRCTMMARRLAKDELKLLNLCASQLMKGLILVMSPAQTSHLTIQTRESEFTGKIRWVQIDLGEDSHDHLITPEQRLHLAMNRQ